MLVSIVIPAFNAEDLIAETLGTVLEQSYRDLEIVLINDGSTDRTAQIAETALRKGRLPYQIIEQSNRGVSAARNRGWRAARGEWIQFLDADDLLHPRKIEIQMMQCSACEPVDVIYSDWQRIVCSGGVWRKEQKIRSPTIGEYPLADILMAENFQQLGSQLISVSVLHSVGGFDESHSLVEDVELCIKIAMAKGMFAKAQSAGPIFWYRDRPRSLSKSDPRRFVEACIRNAKLVEEYTRANAIHEPTIVDAIVDVYFGGARYFASHDWKRFEEIVRDIEALRPAFVPSAPAQLNLLSRIAGYRRAEWLALLYRRGKSMMANAWRDRSARS